MISSINPGLFPGFCGFQRVGEGSYGVIYSAMHKKTGAQIAIKTVDKINLMTETNRSVLASEISAYEKIDHPYLTHFYGHVEDHAGVYLIIEKVSNGSLLDKIMKKGKIKETDALKMFCQLISAIRYLHDEAKIVHRDIKPENILLDDNSDIRLIDFGLSGKMGKGETFNEKCGSLPYSAPEMLKGHRYTKAIDIWSAGVTLYTMVTGTQPFLGQSVKEIYNKIAFYNPQFPNYLSPSLVDLLSKMLNKNPEERITLDGISRHPWVMGSRYYYVVLPQFNEKKKYKIVVHSECDINKALIKQIEDMGYNTLNITTELLEKKVNEETLLYKYFAKQDLMQKLKSPEEVRNMFSAKRRNERKIVGYNSLLSVKPIQSRRSQYSLECKNIKLQLNTNLENTRSKLPRLSPLIKKSAFL